IDADADRERPVRLIRLVSSAQTLIERRVVRTPYTVADAHPLQVDVIAAHDDFREAAGNLALYLRAALLEIVYAAAFFLLRRVARVEDDAVAALQRRFQLDEHAFPRNFLNSA